MKLITTLAAIIAAASSNPIYTTQPTEHFANNAETYQSALEQQQQGIYGDQSQHSQTDYSQSQAGYSRGQTVAFPSGQTQFAGQSVFSGVQNGYQNQQQQQQRTSTEKTARIISFQNENKGNSYQYSFETENGIKVQERGQSQGKGIQVQGGYSYTGDDGQVYTVTYTADENGFRPQGNHLPTPPPIPDAIKKSIEQNTKEQANGVFDDGSYKEDAELQRYHQHQQVHRQRLPVYQSHQIQQHHDAHQVQQLQEIHQVQEQPIQEVQVQHIQHAQEHENPAYQQEYQQRTSKSTSQNTISRKGLPRRLDTITSKFGIVRSTNIT
ncbi:uncharacterized protein [Choristoneura fumiferana]